MTSKKLGDLLMEIILFISYYFSAKLTSVFLCNKDLKKHLLIKENIEKFPRIHLQTTKNHQHRITKTRISLIIILIVFKYFIVSLVPPKLLLWQQHHFCLFQLASFVNSLWCQVCIFYCLFRKKRCTLLLEHTDVHIQQCIHQKYLNLCLP